MTKRPMTRPRSLAAALATASLITGLLLASTDASAQTAAYTSEPVELYAGPAGDYPVVSELGPGVPVTVMGCVSDYSWCDVTVPGLRGWVYAAYLSYPYQGAYVPLAGYGAVIGLPIVAFSIGSYWGSFYRDRPWYGEQGRWAHVPPTGGGRPPAPPPWHGAPGAGRPPVNGGEPRPPVNVPGNMPPGAGHPTANMPPQPYAPRPQEAGRPPAPEPHYGGRPPAGGPAPGYAHAPSAQPPGGMHAPGPAPQQGRPEPPQGGHSSGQGNGRGDDREH